MWLAQSSKSRYTSLQTGSDNSDLQMINRRFNRFAFQGTKLYPIADTFCQLPRNLRKGAASADDSVIYVWLIGGIKENVYFCIAISKDTHTV